MPDQAAIATLLGETAFFAQLSVEARLGCAQAFREQRFDQGQTLFSRGDPGDQLLLVEQGRVRLAVTTEDGRELSMRHAARGELLGEIAVLDGGTRSADAVALTPVVVHGLRRAQLQQFAAQHTAVSSGIIDFLCRRLRQTTDQLEGIALFSIEVRLARFLLVGLAGRVAPVGKRVPLDIAFSQTELAQLLGASRPKVNAALGALEQAGAIKRTSDRIFCDRVALTRCAGLSDG